MKERIKSIDCLRGIAILAVLLIHTTTRTLEASNFNLVGFSFTLFLNQIARFAVPMFFIISGFVLEISDHGDLSYWSFIKKRFSKVFIPYVFWSLIYYFLVYNSNHDNLFKVFLTGNASYQLYFIPALLVFYLTFPLLHKLFQKISNEAPQPNSLGIFSQASSGAESLRSENTSLTHRLMSEVFAKGDKILFVLSFILGVTLLYINYYIKAFDLGDFINVIILAYSFFVMGVFAAKNRDKIDIFVNKFKLFIAIPTTLLGLYVFWEGRSRYLLTGNYLSYYSQWRPSILIYTILICLTLYYIFEHTNLKGTLISRFSKHSFFVFFIHVAVLEFFWKYLGKSFFPVTENFFGKVIFDPIFFAVVAIVSFLIAKFIHKIPKLIKLIG
jgi:surface polysaccharide O-acyltransferase-like enzyme